MQIVHTHTVAFTQIDKCNENVNFLSRYQNMLKLPRKGFHPNIKMLPVAWKDVNCSEPRGFFGGLITIVTAVNVSLSRRLLRNHLDRRGQDAEFLLIVGPPYHCRGMIHFPGVCVAFAFWYARLISDVIPV